MLSRPSVFCLSFRLSPKDQTRQIPEDQRGGDAACCGFQGARQSTQQSLGVHRLADPLGDGVAKARQGGSGACACKVHQWLVDANGTNMTPATT